MERSHCCVEESNLYTGNMLHFFFVVKSANKEKIAVCYFMMFDAQCLIVHLQVRQQKKRFH